MGDSTFIAVAPQDKCVVALLKCEKVGAREAQVLEGELKEAAGKKAWRLVVDMSEVTLLASMGLGMLVTMHKECNAQGGKLAICGMKPELQQLLKVTHLDRVLKLVADQAAGIKMVG